MPRTIQPQATQYPGRVELRFPYDAGLVAALKADIPPEYRSYDPDSKAWTVRHPHDAAALDLLREFFPEATVRGIGQQAPPPPPPPYFRQQQQASPHAVLHLLPTAPPEVVRAAYNALVKKHHPDVAAPEQKLLAHQAMLQLNAAIASLREEGAA